MMPEIEKPGDPRSRDTLDRHSQAFLCGRILKHPGASAANAADRASSIDQMKSDTRGPSNSRRTLVKVGRRSVVRIARRLTAKGLKYRFLAFDPASTVDSEIREWTAKLRVKHQIHDRGNYREVQLLALPKAAGTQIRYTTDATSPEGRGYATYDGPVRVPERCRVVRAMAVHEELALSSEIVAVQIPQAGSGQRPPIDLKAPARWTKQTKLDDTAAVWEFVDRLAKNPGVLALDVGITAESPSGNEHVDYSGAVEEGYTAEILTRSANTLQGLVGAGSLRMLVGGLRFPTGQALLDWLRANNHPFDATGVDQK
jgi:hypothetical protein